MLVENSHSTNNVNIKRDILKSGTDVADVGCGDRFLEPEFEKLGMNYEGYDIEDGNIETDPINVRENSFDLMVSYSLIEHLHDPSNFLSEANRCLKTNGIIVIETPNWRYCKNDFYNDYTHVKPYTPTSLKTLLNHHGFNALGDFPNLRCKSMGVYK